MRIKLLLSCLVTACVLSLGAAQAQDLALAQTSGAVGVNTGNAGVMFYWNGWGDPYGPHWDHRPPPPPPPPPPHWGPPPPPVHHWGPPPPPHHKGWGPPHRPPKHKRHHGHR